MTFLARSIWPCGVDRITSIKKLGTRVLNLLSAETWMWSQFV